LLNNALKEHDEQLCYLSKNHFRKQPVKGKWYKHVYRSNFLFGTASCLPILRMVSRAPQYITRELEIHNSPNFVTTGKRRNI